MEKQNSYSFLRKKLEKMFTEAGIDELADIDWIMVEVTGKQRSMLPFVEYSEEDIQKEIEELEKSINKRKNLLSNENFVKKAPENIVANEKQKLIEEEEKLSKLKN